MELVPEDHRRAGCLIAHSAHPKPASPGALTGCVRFGCLCVGCLNVAKVLGAGAEDGDAPPPELGGTLGRWSGLLRFSGHPPIDRAARGEMRISRPPAWRAAPANRRIARPLVPASSTVPAATENEHQNDQDDEERRVVHHCLPSSPTLAARECPSMLVRTKYRDCAHRL